MKFRPALHIICTILFIIFLGIVHSVPLHALYDPLSRDNNFFGIHILFPEEIERARKLINANGGAWGYVTIPIQITDRNLFRWQEFMNKAYEYKVTPIIRLATEPDRETPGVWRKPNDYDIVDFANFLNSLDWPVENRYIIVFNEVNRFDEWGGYPPSPSEYAEILAYAVDAFKARSQDFFIISAGLDSAAPNDGIKYMNASLFLQRIESARPGIFNRVDGIANHSYPNPNFSAPPDVNRRIGVATYKYEYDLVNRFASSKKPVFITETGWNNQTLTDETIASYYSYTFQEIWQQDSDKIVAITPFLLESQNGQFDKFSFYKDGFPKMYHAALENLPKKRGKPTLRVHTITRPPHIEFYTVRFENNEKYVEEEVIVPELFRFYGRMILGVH